MTNILKLSFLVVPDENEVISSSALIYLATNHLPAQVDQDAASMYASGSMPATGSLVQGPVPMQYSTNQVGLVLLLSRYH